MIEPNWVWGVIEIFALCVICMFGMHIFIALGIFGVVFAFLYNPDMSSMWLIGNVSWDRLNHYTLSMIPLFVLMGSWVASAGVGRDAFDACMRWLTRVKGALAIVSILANGLFAAVTGSSLSTVATIGGVALPEMKRYGYNAPLRTGSITSGSMLANLIPPSTACIIYALFTDVSVGKLFIAGIIPGIILMTLFCIVIYVWVSLRPEIAPMLPPDVRFTWKDRFQSLTMVFPIVLIFLVLIGGIYLGWFSPTEAAGIGAVTVLIVVLSFRRLDWKAFNAGMLSAIKTSGMILIMIMAAFIFTSTIALTRLAPAIVDIVTAAGLSFVPLAYILIVLFILAGMFLDAMAIQVLFLPILFPVVTSVPGAPPMVGVWFGTLVVLLIQLAHVTPPIASALYLTQIMDGSSTRDVVWGVTPFYSATLILLVLLVHFPFLSTWLPSQMIGS